MYVIYAIVILLVAGYGVHSLFSKAEAEDSEEFAAEPMTDMEQDDDLDGELYGSYAQLDDLTWSEDSDSHNLTPNDEDAKNYSDEYEEVGR